MHARRTKLENRGRDGSPRVASERISLSFTPSGDILRRLKMSFTPSGVPHSTLRWSTRHGVRCCTPYLAAGWMDTVHWTAITYLKHTVQGRHCSHIPLPQLSQLGSMDGQRSLTSNGVRVDLSSASLGPSTSPESDSGRNPRPSVISLLAQRTNQHTTAVSGISTRAGAWAVGPQRGFLPLSFFHPRPTITSLPTEHVNDTQQL